MRKLEGERRARCICANDLGADRFVLAQGELFLADTTGSHGEKLKAISVLRNSDFSLDLLFLARVGP